LNETERSVFARALSENAGRLPLTKLMDWSALGQGRARAMQEEWAQRGWIAKAPGQDNAYCLTERGKALIQGENPTALQTLQTPTNSNKPEPGSANAAGKPA
jgi:predicted transcriptional regulator